MRYDDSHPSPNRWTNAKLMREAKRMGPKGPDFGGPFAPHTNDPDYRAQFNGWAASWLMPVLNEIERRFIKPKKGKDVQD